MDSRIVPVDGSRLTGLGPGIWAADRELILAAGIRVPVRMVVIRTDGRRLLCYSPVSLDEPTVEALAGLGEVRWLICPNRSHGLFLEEAAARYPAAAVIGCHHAALPGGSRRLDGSGILAGDLEYFTAAPGPRFSEIALYHDPSETLVLADLVLNFQLGERRLRWLLRLNGAWGRPAHSRLQRWLVFRRPADLADFYHWAMARPFRQIAVCHGPVIREQAREWLYRLFVPYVTNGKAVAR
jgi:hypothetical protein